MLKIALNVITRRRLRFAMTASAIGLIVFMFILLNSSIEGLLLTFVGHVEQTKADLWVLPASDQVTGVFINKSFADKIRKVEGVDDVERVLEVPAYVKFKDREARIIIAGYDTDGFNRPEPLIDGSRSDWRLSPGIVVDRSLAMNLPGLGVEQLEPPHRVCAQGGDILTIGGPGELVR